MTGTNPNDRLLRFLSATPEQQAAVDQFLRASWRLSRRHLRGRCCCA